MAYSSTFDVKAGGIVIERVCFVFSSWSQRYTPLLHHHFCHANVWFRYKFAVERDAESLDARLK